MAKKSKFLSWFGFGKSEKQQAEQTANEADNQKQLEEQQRIEAEKAQAASLEQERIAAEKAEAERIAAEQQAAEQRRQEQQARLAEQEAAMKLEQERIAAEQAQREADQIAAEKAQAERVEQERIAAEKAEAERLEQARIAAEKAEAERVEQARIAAEKAEAERVEQARIAAEKAEAERVEQARIAAEKAEAERLEQERIAAEKAEAERLEQERIAAEKAEAERIEQARIEKEKTEQVTDKPKKEGFFARLKKGLLKTRVNIGSGFASIFSGKKIDDELFEELETQLLTADLGVDTTMKLIDNLTDAADRKQLKDGDALYELMKQEMAAMLKTAEQPLTVPENKKPFVILMVGVNGVGKTTTIGKLAKQFQNEGKSVMLAAGILSVPPRLSNYKCGASVTVYLLLHSILVQTVHRLCLMPFKRRKHVM